MRQHKKDLWIVAVLATALLVVAVLWPKEATDILPVRSLAQIKHSGELIVLIQNTPTVYYLDRHEEESGPEYELAVAFAKKLGVTPVFVVKNSVQELIDAISRGEGDLATAGLSITSERKRKVLFGPAYQQVSQQVVCRRGEELPRKIEDLLKLDKELVVIAGSSYEERLKGLKKKHPRLTWRASSGLNAEQILERIWQRKIGCTVMDSTIVSINQRYYPELRVRFELGKTDELAWAMPKRANQLQEAAFKWYKEFKTSGQVARLQELYYGHVKLFDYVDTRAFKRRITERYPKFEKMFEKAAEDNDLSVTLLAAQSYQESHWNPDARSPTGVRGMMMLTWPTAKAMGVKNRLNAKQSIFGGAKYLAKLRYLLEDELQEPDLTWMSLAAYNVGLGHLRDAQTLARRQGKNETRWYDIKMMLPLLSDKKYYSTVKYGYARGSEPVRYVQQVREYRSILKRHFRDERTRIIRRPNSGSAPKRGELNR